MTNIKNLTQDLRKKHGINPYDSINIIPFAFEVLENLTITWFPCRDNVKGFSSKLNNSNIILINSKHNLGIQNLTIAHELYHLLYGNEEFNYCLNEQYNKIENNANEFSTELLLPKKALNIYMGRKNIKKWTLKDIIQCEQYYQISHEEILNRLLNENIISQNECDRYNVDIKNIAKKLGFKTDLYEMDKEYYTIGEIIPENEEAYKNHRISQGLYKEILNAVNRLDII